MSHNVPRLTQYRIGLQNVCYSPWFVIQPLGLTIFINDVQQRLDLGFILLVTTGFSHLRGIFDKLADFNIVAHPLQRAGLICFHRALGQMSTFVVKQSMGVASPSDPLHQNPKI